MKNIAIAFIKAKKDFSPALKNKTNGGFKSKYADLAACLDAVDDAFLNNGIAMYQETFEDTTGVTIETILLHESGEVLRCGKLHLPAAKQDPQGYGSALSYARRYSLMTACGIAQEDDDGNGAVKAINEAKQGQKDRPPIENDRFELALASIQKGEYTSEKLLSTFILSINQSKRLGELNATH
jgi:hypothetical protein